MESAILLYFGKPFKFAAVIFLLHRHFKLFYEKIKINETNY